MMLPVTAPTVEPVTVADIRMQLRQAADDPNALINLSRPDDDSWITLRITAAREYAEGFLGYALTDAVYMLIVDAFDTADLPVWANSVTKVEYLDAAHAKQTLDPSLYYIDPYAQALYFEGTMPEISTRTSPIRIFFKGALTPTAVPASVKQAIALTVAHWYTNREAASEGSMFEIPLGVEALLRPYRMALGMA